MNKSRLQGVDQDPQNNQIIYKQYLRAFKKGVFNFIKEDVDKYSNETIPRKYFSGGVLATAYREKLKIDKEASLAQLADAAALSSQEDFVSEYMSPDAAMNVNLNEQQQAIVNKIELGLVNGKISTQEWMFYYQSSKNAWALGGEDLDLKIRVGDIVQEAMGAPFVVGLNDILKEVTWNRKVDVQRFRLQIPVRRAESYIRGRNVIGLEMYRILSKMFRDNTGEVDELLGLSVEDKSWIKIQQFLDDSKQGQMFADRQAAVKQMRGQYGALQNRIFELGQKFSLTAHGVEESKGGIRTLLQILLGGKINRGEFGPLVYGDGNGQLYAGPHGPFYVILNPNVQNWRDGDNHFIYLVPEDIDKTFLLEMLNRAKSELSITHATVDKVYKKIFTYKEFIESMGKLEKNQAMIGIKRTMDGKEIIASEDIHALTEKILKNGVDILVPHEFRGVEGKHVVLSSSEKNIISEILKRSYYPGDLRKLKDILHLVGPTVEKPGIVRTRKFGSSGISMDSRRRTDLI